MAAKSTPLTGHISINFQLELWQLSPAAKSLLGINKTDSSSTLALQQLWDMIHPKDIDTLKALFSEQEENKKDQFLSYAFKLSSDAHKSYRDILIEGFILHPTSNTGSTFNGTLTFTSDASVAIEQELVDFSHDLLAILDRDLSYLAVNKPYANIFARSPESFIGQKIRDTFTHDPTHFENIVLPMLKEALNGETIQYENWIELPNFGDTFLDIQYAPYFGQDGSISGVVVIGRNRTEVMKSMEALERSESLLKRSERIASLGGWFYNLANDETTWTDEMYAIHEVDKSFELTQENMLSLMDKKYVSTIRSELQKAFKGKSVDMVAPIVTPKGTRKWVRSLSFPIFENGKVVSIEGILQDTTEIRNIQLKLSQSEEQYRNLIEDSNALVWEAEVNPIRFTSMSPKAFELTGYTVEQWCSENFLRSKIHPEDYEKTFKSAINRTKAKEDFVLEYRIITASGSIIWLHDEVKIIVDPETGNTKLRGVMIDISRLKEIQHGLNRALQSLENYKYILDQHAIVASTDPYGNINYANQKFVEITGYEREELLGKNHSLLNSGTHKTSFFEKLWKTIKSGDVWQGEICNRKKTGEMYWVYSTIVPLRDENGVVESYMSVLTETTELKRTEEALRRAQKLEAIGQLTGGIAHDFNNLLSIVIGNLELMEISQGDAKRLQSQLENAKTAATRGSVLTRRLLNFSHQAPVNSEALDINQIILGLEVLISKSLTAQVRVEMQLAENLWQVEVDAGDLEDAIINLSINASDAMPQGGSLHFSTRNYENARMEFRNNCIIPPGNYVELCISDSGIGMSDELIEKIFEPYFSTKPSDKGSGLGLAMVYGFIQRSKGIIFVESKVDMGTTFHILLPKSKHASSVPTDLPKIKSDESVTAKNNETILLVDDEVDILRITKINLENLGYSVVTCKNAEEALIEINTDQHFDLLFTDIVMPGKLNGFELAECALKIRPELRVLFTSGYAKVENKVTRKDWSDALLHKPYRSSELAQKIRQTLDQENK